MFECKTVYSSFKVLCHMSTIKSSGRKEIFFLNQLNFLQLHINSSMFQWASLQPRTPVTQDSEIIKDVHVRPGMVVHACNPNYMGGRKKEDHISGQPQTKT
jgi:hypothetical protein